jgi:hypothetical protein
LATLVSFQHHLTRSLSVYGEGQGWLVLAVIGSALGTRLLEWVVKRLNNKGF